MCGIYGSTKIYDPSVISAKLKRIAFRGPDASTFRNFDNRVILGHNRLSIIDLDERANQPFEYEHIAIVFNGEIYNFQDVRNDLEKRGFRFRTTSDTEVICAAYLAFGDDCVKHWLTAEPMRSAATENHTHRPAAPTAKAASAQPKGHDHGKAQQNGCQGAVLRRR